jgi:hypothetical protein
MLNPNGEPTKTVLNTLEYGKIEQSVIVMLGSIRKPMTFGLEYSWSYADKGGELIDTVLNGTSHGKFREDFGESIVTTLMEQGFDKDEANLVAEHFETWIDGHADEMCLDIFMDGREYQNAHESA